MKLEYVYANNQLFGHFQDNVYINYTLKDKEELLESLKKEVKEKDYRRKMFSLIIGLVMLVIAIVVATLNLIKTIDIGWFNYTFVLVLLMLVWVFFYYVFGLIFYSKIKINVMFKSHKMQNINSCVTYASSQYCKWLDNYSTYLKNTNFQIEKKNKKKNELVPFGIKKPSNIKNIIFNGSVSCNVPYYYLSFKNKKMLFLPGFIILVDGKNSDIIYNNELKVTEKEKTYQIYKNDKLIVSFKCFGEFDINFFYFKYNQI